MAFQSGRYSTGAGMYSRISKHLLNSCRYGAALFFTMVSMFFLPGISAAAGEDQQAIPHFDIQRYEVEGNTVLPADVVGSLFTPFTGKDRDFGTVQEALEALEKAYRDRGFSMVQVILPEQELEKGVVRFKVIEAHIRKIAIEGNRFFDQANIRRSLPALQEGKSPNMDALSASLKLVNESPAKKVGLQLQNSENETDINANLKVTDEKPWRIGLTADNTGNSQTGSVRLGLLYQNANVFNRDHLLTLQYATSPEKPDKVAIYSAGYRIPFYSIGSSLDLVGGYSDVDSGNISAGGYNLNVSGKGTILGAHFNQNLKRIESYEHKIVYALDYRAYQNSIDLSGTPIGNDVTVHPASVTYAGSWTLPKGGAGFYLTAVQNLPGGMGGRDTHEYFERVRSGAPVKYHMIRYGADLAYILGRDWQGRINFNAQYTDKPLVPGEQFGLGGEGSVRGFQEREVSNDNGYTANFEIYTPELCTMLKTNAALQCRALAFYDKGYVSRQDPLPGEVVSTQIASTGLGLRITSGDKLFILTDCGTVVDPGGLRPRWSSRWHIKAGMFF